ncbi:MAG: hypothetical protein JST66_13405 [Bacteroidetes bacterium]|nr:hypothetical protein [Bacteroidota bacterium]
MDLQRTMNDLREMRSGVCVTITANAGDAPTDAARVRDELKGAFERAERHLLERYDKHGAAPVIQHLRDIRTALRAVDERPGIVVFASAKGAQMVHLPFPVQPRIIVGGAFFLRDLLRAELDRVRYQVLLLASDHADLYEADDDRLVRRVPGPFPLRNRHYTTDVIAITTPRGQEHQERSFHKEVDDAVRNAVGTGGRVVVACVADLYGRFLQDVRDRHLYAGHLKGSFDHVPMKALVGEAWELVHAAQKQERMEELEQAIATMRGRSSILEIWRQVREGRGHILFVERDKHQPALIDDDQVTLLEDRPDAISGEDLVDAILDEQLRHGGDIRILPNGSMHGQDGLVLKLRY